MRTGQRSPTSPSEEESRTGLPSATTVSQPSLLLPLLPSSQQSPTGRFSPAKPTLLTTGKKLKKRLEDLERRAGSSSASPEQRPAELHRRSIEPRDDSSSSRAPRTSGDRARSSSSGQHTPDPLHHPHPLYPHPHDADWELFAHESSEHYPVSAAPFSSSSSSSSHQHQHNHQHPAYTSSIAYPGAAATATANAYPHHPHYPVSDADPMLWMSGMPQFSASYDGAVKGLDGSGAGGHPFQLGYASIAGADVAGSHYYQDPNAQVMNPDLIDLSDPCFSSP